MIIASGLRHGDAVRTRRALLTAAVAAPALSWIRAALAQTPSKVRRIGLLSAHTARETAAWDDAFRSGLRERGWRIKGVAVLGQDGGGVRATNLRQYIQAGTAPINVTAREVRAQFGWL